MSHQEVVIDDPNLAEQTLPPDAENWAAEFEAHVAPLSPDVPVPAAEDPEATGYQEFSIDDEDDDDAAVLTPKQIEAKAQADFRYALHDEPKLDPETTAERNNPDAPLSLVSQAFVIDHALERLPENDVAAQELRVKAQLVARLAVLEGFSKLDPAYLEELSANVDDEGKPLEGAMFESRPKLELAQDARYTLNDYAMSKQLGIDTLPREGTGGEIVNAFTADERALVYWALKEQVDQPFPVHADDLVEREDKDGETVPVDDKAEKHFADEAEIVLKQVDDNADKYFADEARILLEQAFPEGSAELIGASVEADDAARSAAALGAVATVASVQR